MSHKTVLEVIEVLIAELEQGDVFWFGDAENEQHVKLRDDDPFLDGTPGQVYSTRDGKIYEHNPWDLVSYFDIRGG